MLEKVFLPGLINTHLHLETSLTTQMQRPRVDIVSLLILAIPDLQEYRT